MTSELKATPGDAIDPIASRTRSATARLLAWRTEVTGTDPSAWPGALRASILDSWESLGCSRSRAQNDMADALSRAQHGEEAFLEAVWIAFHAMDTEDTEAFRAAIADEV